MHILILIRKYGIVIILFLMVTLFTISSDFLKMQSILNVVRQASIIGIMSAGMSFVIIAGGMDLSVGAQVSVVGVFTAWLMVYCNLNPILATLIGILFGTAIGVLNGLLIIKLKLVPMIFTLVMGIILKGVSNIFNNGISIYGFDDAYAVIGQGYIGSVPIPIIIWIIVIAISAIILIKTYFGRFIYAIGGNIEAARFSGIKTDRVKFSTYVLCSFFTSVAGIIMLSRVNSGSPTTGIGLELDCLAACCLGGLSIQGGEGSIFGTMAGVLVIGVLSNGLTLLNVGGYYTDIVKGIILIFALSMDSFIKVREKEFLEVTKE